MKRVTSLDVGQVVEISLPGGGSLVLIKANSSNYLLRSQLYDKYARGHCGETHFSSLCKDARKAGGQTLAGPRVLADLHKVVAIKPRTPAVVVVTVAQGLAALRRAKVRLAQIQELQAAVGQAPRGPPVQDRGMPSSSSCQDTLLQPPAEHHFCHDLPSELPSSFPATALGGRFGLRNFPRLLQQPVLQAQLAAFRSFYSKLFNFERKGRALVSQSVGTVANDLLMILGFLHSHLGIQAPQLHDLLNADWIATYMASRVQAGQSQGSLTHDMDALAKLVQFWLGHRQLQPQVAQQLHRLETWLQKLRQQVRHHRPQVRKDPFAMQAAGKWVDATTLVQCFEQARLEVLQVVQEWKRVHPGQPLGLATAQQLQEALFANLLFGYLPPMRLECIKTMTVPGAACGCQEEECTLGPGCGGNRCERTGQHSIKLVFPHHKNTRTWGNAIVLESLPSELTQLFVLYLDEALPRLHQQFPSARQHDRVFFTRSGAVHKVSLSTYFNSVLHRLGIPAHVHIAPQHLRHIFIDERRGVQPAAGPSDGGAALVMGNSPATWSAWYDLAKWDGRSAQRAVDDMSPWRAAMLRGSSAGAQQAAVQPVLQLSAPDLVPLPVAADLPGVMDEGSQDEDEVQQQQSESEALASGSEWESESDASGSAPESESEGSESSASSSSSESGSSEEELIIDIG